MAKPGEPYYRADLALVHHLGFGFHADDCAPGVLELLAPVRERDGLVVELGCGSGLLTRYLVDAGHRVIATDASPAMLDLARAYATGAQEIRELVLPDDSIPQADAIVSIGHVLSYLPDPEAIDRALVAIAEALRPGGLLAIDRVISRTPRRCRASRSMRGWPTGGPSSPSAPRRRPTGSSVRWPSSPATRTARGAETTSVT
jgi:SAM-dependent methyltransferase